MVNGDASSYLTDLIIPTAVATTRAELRSTESHTVVVLRGGRAFAIAASRGWNKVPLELRATMSN